LLAPGTCTIGIEDVDDIIWDLEQALAKSQSAVSVAVEANGHETGHSILSKAFGAPYQS